MGSLNNANPYSCISELSFRLYSDEEIKKISVIEIKNHYTVDALGHPVERGLNDLHMGPMKIHEGKCSTCKNDYVCCPGHYGYISLPFPVMNPVLSKDLEGLLNIICPFCFRFQVKPNIALQFVHESLLFEAGYDLKCLEVGSLIRNVMMHSDEAVEASSTANEWAGLLLQLEKKLRKFSKAVKKEDTTVGRTTCQSEGVYMDIHKNFKSLCRKKTMCIYCQRCLPRIKIKGSQINVFFKGGMNQVDEQDKSSEMDTESIDGEKVKNATTNLYDGQPYMTCSQAKNVLEKCYAVDGYILKHFYPMFANSNLKTPTDLFFLKNLFVIPPRFRPARVTNSMRLEHDLTVIYSHIIRISCCVTYLLQTDMSDDKLPDGVALYLKEFRGENMNEKVLNIWTQLQAHVDNWFDANMSQKAIGGTSRGLSQLVEKKFGQFRRNLMGKRVDYTARSVAAPDAMLAVDEVGIPIEFALKLTYPVPVTPWNVPMLRKLVQNGANVHPGAVMVENERGQCTALSKLCEKQRNAIAKGLLTPTPGIKGKKNAFKIVYRHMQNGDIALVNRQPTLHRPSIQAHRVRITPLNAQHSSHVKPERVIRLPYAVCKAYNADFDGDELNVHFPQSELARSEGYHIMAARKQYLTPKDGSPLAGLIQDCVVGSVIMTLRDSFLNKEDYQQLVYVSLAHLPRRLRLLPPTIVKPKMLWTGKQVVSTMILNIIPEQMDKLTFNFRTTVKVDMWQREEPRPWKGGGEPESSRTSMTDSELIIRHGELLCGVIDKCAIGSTKFGLVHTLYDLYGGQVASHMMTAISRACITFLQWHGHTISLKEFVTLPKHAHQRRKRLKRLIARTEEEVTKKLGLEPGQLAKYAATSHSTNNKKEMGAIDAAYTSVLGPETSEVTFHNEKQLLLRNLKNRMRMMVDTGAKGSRVNMNQMASLFGSVAIDGHRMPLSITGKSLPSTPPYDTDPRAGGYIPDRFVTGMDPKCYFFLCIVGRDSLQHTAVKTANSGYMQRCLIKHLEGIHVEYDMTVRNSDGLVLQFQYGEDGLDVIKVPFLSKPDTLNVIVDNSWQFLKDKNAINARQTTCPKVDKYKKRVKKYKESDSKDRDSPFLRFCNEQRRLEGVESSNLDSIHGRSSKSLLMIKSWFALSEIEKSEYKIERSLRGRDPVTCHFRGVSHVNVMNEALDDLMDSYYEKQYRKRVQSLRVLDKNEIKDVMGVKVMNSYVDPGDAVGALCAQALGEPLTQMTLNTFHFAGRDELNVTMGVPRMIEILKTASKNIKTPVMEVPFLPHIARAEAEKLAVKLTPVKLADVLNKVDVVTWVSSEGGEISEKINITLHFLRPEDYYKVFVVRPAGILQYIESHFITKVVKSILKAVDKQQQFISTNTAAKDALSDDDSDEVGVGNVEENERNNEREENDEEKDSDDEEDNNRFSEAEEEASDQDKSDVVDLDSDDYAEPPQETPVPKLSTSKKAFCSEADYESRCRRVTVYNSVVENYSFDNQDGVWVKATLSLPPLGGTYDLANILKSEAHNALLHKVSDVKKAVVAEPDKGEGFLLRTEGVALQEMASYCHLVDINRLYTNNIAIMMTCYGIEAAQRCIVREIRSVLAAYDIGVDFRHLTLLADYFTCEGVYKGVSWSSLSTCSSLVQRMSFERLFHGMRRAILESSTDYMRSPSSSVMVGQPVNVGTNFFGLRFKLDCDVRELPIK